MKKIARESNIELLRLFLMFMVVGLHVLYHGILNVDKPAGLDNGNYYAANIFESIFICAVNCFIIISGYFKIRFNVVKVAKLILMMWFYSVSIYLVFVFLKIIPFNVKELIGYNVPFFWWFIYYYIILIFLSPALNIIIDNTDKRSISLILAAFFLFFCIIPTVTPFSFTNDRGFGIVNFIFMYLIGSYIRNYCSDKRKNIFWISVFVISAICSFAGNAVILKITGINKGWSAHFFGYDTVFVIICAIALFMVFRGLSIKSTVINALSPSVLGVYLIHEHALVRGYIYEKIFNLPDYYHSRYFAIHLIAVVVVIFTVCLIIESIRVRTISVLEDKLIDKVVCSKYSIRMKEWADRLLTGAGCK